MLLRHCFFFLTNTFLVTTAIHFASQTPWREVWRRNSAWIAASYLLLSPIALLLARAYETPLLAGWGGWTVLFFLIPLYYSRFYWDEKVRLEQAFDATLETLMHALEAKETETRLHSERVAEIARDLARRVKKDEVYAQAIYRAARLHDIGKIGIPEAVLLKPGPLSPAEREAVERHPKFGVEILKPGKKVAFEELVYNVVLYHHERWDGRGYPERLAGHEIPEEARIVGLADAYEAMTAGRPYRKAKTPEEALREVQDMSGIQFDPRLVEPSRRSGRRIPCARPGSLPQGKGGILITLYLAAALFGLGLALALGARPKDFGGIELRAAWAFLLAASWREGWPMAPTGGSSPRRWQGLWPKSWCSPWWVTASTKTVT